MQEGVRGFKFLVTPTLYAREWSELLPIMLRLVSTDYDFSQTWNLLVHVTTILSKQEGTYCMSVEDLTGIGIRKETH